MKNILLLVLSLSSFGLSGQSLSISQSAVALAVNGHLIYGDVLVTNTTASQLTVKVRQEAIQTSADEKIQICWGGLCFNWTGGDYTYGTPAMIDPAQAYDGLAVSFQQNMATEGSVWRVCLFVDGSPDDEVCLEVTFGTVGLAEIKTISPELGNAKPNPTSTFSKIPFVNPTGDARILVRNLMGQTVADYNLPAGEGSFNLNVSEFENGVYFYSLVKTNEVLSTRRLLVGQ